MLLHPNCCSTSAPTYLDPIRSYICTLYDINNQSSCTITSASHMHRHICVQAHLYIYMHLLWHQKSMLLHRNFCFTYVSTFLYPSTSYICICIHINSRCICTLTSTSHQHRHIDIQAHITYASALTSIIDSSEP